MGLPKHVPFKVSQLFAKRGYTSPWASVEYGPLTGEPMLSFRDSLIIFADERLRKNYKRELAPDSKTSTYPVHTRMKAIVLNGVNLGDVLVKDGKESFVGIKSPSEVLLTEFIQVDDKLLTLENKNKSRQIIKAESNWKTTKNGNVFETRMLEGNDQVSIGIQKGDTRLEHRLKDIRNLLFSEKEMQDQAFVDEFLREYGDLVTYLFFQPTKVAGGLVSAGAIGMGTYQPRASANVPDSDISNWLGVLTQR